ncbi:MAG: SMC-Scp complex subunit ScpB [Nitrospirota bacterium]|nr:SMC-Scp complex subunit ScpB [Nitrospirota bacterium]
MDPFQDVHNLYKAIIEALLLVSTEPLTLQQVTDLLEGQSRADVEKIIEDLRASYDREGRGFQVVAVAGGYQLVTRPEYARWIRQLKENKSQTALSRPALETLAIIAYKQPVIRADIDDIRGVNSGGVLKNLMERGLVKIAGRKDLPGRPIMYATTTLFLKQFGLVSLKDLPSLKEFEQVLEAD